ncbi:MAG: histidine phosphatase family protein [Hyphomicrobiales bacterium]|nr:histidine phosphatase family protein [Hyphomicrobiales bacterium]
MLRNVFKAAISLVLAVLALAAPSSTSHASEAASWAALGRGAIVLFRHANAPGGGDPPGFQLGDCSTQRNLDDEGRRQAVRIGETFRQHGIAVGAVLTSQWCRAVQTAELGFRGQARVEPAFNSFFDEPSKGPERTATARFIMLGWRGPGALVVTTHQVNIAALTGISPASGEGVVLERNGDALQIVGRIKP